MIELARGGPDDVAVLAGDLHPLDAAELRAAGLDVVTAVSGVPVTVAKHDGQVIAVFGCAAMPGQHGAGIPWMLCTSAIDAAPRRSVAIAADRVVSGWMATHARLSNLVHRRNTRALSFIRWLGFTVGDQPAGPGGEFFLFEWSAASCATP